MKDYIILTGIGNRNIRYLNQGYKNDLIPREVFYEKTKFIWEHPTEFKNITPHIIPPLLDEYPNSQLVMFTTHQEPPYQDTYYEGLILKKIFEERYPNTRIEAVEIKGINPTDTDELISWFKRRVQYLIFKNPKSKFIIYETGGTHQLKNALKSVCEFYMVNEKEDNYLKIYQGIESGVSTEIREVKRDSIEELNLLINVKLLVAHNDYKGGMLLGDGVLNKNPSKLIEFSGLLWDGMWQEINTRFAIHNFGKSLKRSPAFSLIESLITTNNNSVSNDLGLHNKFHRVCMVLLSKSYNSAMRNDFSSSILAFHQFIEYFTSSYIESQSEYRLIHDRKNYQQSLLDFIKENYESKLLNLLGDMPSFLSFPVCLVYAEILAQEDNNQTVVKVIQSIKATQGTFNKNQANNKLSLDAMRNRLSHDGRGVNEQDFKVFESLIKECHSLFNSDEDVFQGLNDFIFELI